jgi:hypothetical protein
LRHKNGPAFFLTDQVKSLRIFIRVAGTRLKDHAPMRQDVYLTVHGPIFPQDKGIKGEMIALPSTGTRWFQNSGNSQPLDTHDFITYTHLRNTYSLSNIPAHCQTRCFIVGAGMDGECIL